MCVKHCRVLGKPTFKLPYPAPISPLGDAREDSAAECHTNAVRCWAVYHAFLIDWISPLAALGGGLVYIFNCSIVFFSFHFSFHLSPFRLSFCSFLFFCVNF
jgi:hypothetical protein